MAEDLSELTDAEAVAWLAHRAPIDVTGFGPNFTIALGELRAADRVAMIDDASRTAQAIMDDITADLRDGIKRQLFSECIQLVDDASAIGADPKAAIQREREKLDPEPVVPPERIT